MFTLKEFEIVVGSKQDLIENNLDLFIYSIIFKIMC